MKKQSKQKEERFPIVFQVENKTNGNKTAIVAGLNHMLHKPNYGNQAGIEVRGLVKKQKTDKEATVEFNYMQVANELRNPCKLDAIEIEGFKNEKEMHALVYVWLHPSGANAIIPFYPRAYYKEGDTKIRITLNDCILLNDHYFSFVVLAKQKLKISLFVSEPQARKTIPKYLSNPFQLTICNNSIKREKAILFGANIFDRATNYGSPAKIKIQPLYDVEYSHLLQYSTNTPFKTNKIKITGDNISSHNLSMKVFDNDASGSEQGIPMYLYDMVKDGEKYITTQATPTIEGNSHWEISMPPKTTIKVDIFPEPPKLETVKNKQPNKTKK